MNGRTGAVRAVGAIAPLLHRCAAGPGPGLVLGPAGWTSLLLLIALLAVAYLLRQALEHRGGSGRNRAKELLRERYARGEIDHTEYLVKLKDLDLG
jgi:putative membrane protein